MQIGPKDWDRPAIAACAEGPELAAPGSSSLSGGRRLLTAFWTVPGRVGFVARDPKRTFDDFSERRSSGKSLDDDV